MKVEYNFPDDIYKKFKAALILNDEEENDVMMNILVSYINRLFSNENQSINQTQVPKETEKVPTQNKSPYVQKKEFEDWFGRQTHGNNKHYSNITINSYIGQLENALKSINFDIPQKSIFEISNKEEFRNAKNKIMTNEAFTSYDANVHGAFTAALNMYERFLSDTDGNYQQSTAQSYQSYPQGDNVHHWTFDEDALCCRRYIETYVVNRKHCSLTEFAESLHSEIPVITTNSLRMKAQNIKALCMENGIYDTLIAKPLTMYSKQNERAFETVRKEFDI